MLLMFDIDSRVGLSCQDNVPLDSSVQHSIEEYFLIGLCSLVTSRAYVLLTVYNRLKSIHSSN